MNGATEMNWTMLRYEIGAAIKRHTGDPIPRGRMDAIMRAIMWQTIDRDAWIESNDLPRGSEGIDAFLEHVECLSYQSRQ